MSSQEIQMEAIRIHEADDVAVTLKACAAGAQLSVNGELIVLTTAVPKGHKFALRALEAHVPVRKYGLLIGHTTAPVAKGAHIHNHNMATSLHNENIYHYEPVQNDPIEFSLTAQRPPVFIYRRANGLAGIRNELWIIPTVTCVNALCDEMKIQFEKKHPELNIDAVTVLKHPYGCSQLGADHENTRTILQNMVRHPNAGAVLVVGLGCENNQIAEFRDTLTDYDRARTRFMVCQEEQDEIAVALDHLEALYDLMRHDRRTEGTLSDLKFGLECGGSDAFSGITANPLLGHFSDYIVQHGGTSVLTEVPEMFGAEQTLMNRAINEDVYHQQVAMIRNFKQYFIAHEQPIYENPSPGNKAGGITTLEEKSLGCTQKSGTTQVVDVLEYGMRLAKPGLVLLSAPGNDAVATTALIAAGCQMVLFSTGRGTPYGGVVPTLKISTGSELARQKPHWIDFDAGVLLEGRPMAEVLEAFIMDLCAVINGEKTANEQLNFKEIAIFKSGVTL